MDAQNPITSINKAYNYDVEWTGDIHEDNEICRDTIVRLKDCEDQVKEDFNKTAKKQ